MHSEISSSRSKSEQNIYKQKRILKELKIERKLKKKIKRG